MRTYIIQRVHPAVNSTLVTAFDLRKSLLVLVESASSENSYVDLPAAYSFVSNLTIAVNATCSMLIGRTTAHPSKLQTKLLRLNPPLKLIFC